MANTFIRNQKLSTIDLEKAIAFSPSFEYFIEHNFDQLLEENVVGICLNELVAKYDVSVTIASEKAGYSRSYLSNIINGKRLNPSRDSLLALCFAIGATFDETQDVLKCAGKQPLYVRNKRDVIIWFSLKKSEHLGIVNDNLNRYGYKDLSGKI